MKQSYKSLLFVVFTLIMPMSLWGQDDAREIFDRATGQMLTQNMEIVMEMKITDKKGRTKEKGYEMHAVLKITEMLGLLLESKKISQEQFDSIKEYFADPESWSKKNTLKA